MSENTPEATPPETVPTLDPTEHGNVDWASDTGEADGSPAAEVPPDPGSDEPAPAADATEQDALAENTDATPTPEDGPQDVPQEPVAEADVAAEEPAE